LIHALVKLGPDELSKLTADKPGAGSEYSLLARAIVGTQPPTKPPDSGDAK
jgi:hypothetical protein